MSITIKNKQLQLTVEEKGAQMMALEDNCGGQYLWNGDPKYWKGRAPTLFPFVGRLTNNSYRLRGKTYPMGIHGFAAAQEFSQPCQPDRVGFTKAVYLNGMGAPYVCIEPWSSLPSRQDIVEEFSCKSDMIQLEAGKTYTNTWTILAHREG